MCVPHAASLVQVLYQPCVLTAVAPRTQAARARKERARHERLAAEEAEREEVRACDGHRRARLCIAQQKDRASVCINACTACIAQADRREAAAKAEQRRLACERANKMLFDETDDVKALHSKLMLSEV